jgi:hypothetical protein
MLKLRPHHAIAIGLTIGTSTLTGWAQPRQLAPEIEQ